MGWLDTLLNWLLALLEWVCWPCRLVEWLGGLEQGAAVTLVVGVLNAGAILAAGLLAMKAAQSVLKQKSDTRKFETAEIILERVLEAEQRAALLISACGSTLNSDEDRVDILKSIVDFYSDDYESLLNSTAEIYKSLAMARIYHDNSIYDILERFYNLIVDVNFAYGMLKTISANREKISSEIFESEYTENTETLIDKDNHLLNKIHLESSVLASQLKKFIG